MPRSSPRCVNIVAYSEMVSDERRGVEMMESQRVPEIKCSRCGRDIRGEAHYRRYTANCCCGEGGVSAWLEGVCPKCGVLPRIVAEDKLYCTGCKPEANSGEIVSASQDVDFGVDDDGCIGTEPDSEYDDLVDSMPFNEFGDFNEEICAHYAEYGERVQQ